MQVFGKIGCFFADCCYGTKCENKLLGVFSKRAGELVYPTQLFEAFLILILFIVLLAIKEISGLRVISIYLIGYGLERFFVEFIRGDSIHYVCGFINISQILCLLLIYVGYYLMRKDAHIV